jgi:plastocyanin
MKILFTILTVCVISLSATAQTSYEIIAAGGGFGNPAPSYVPNMLTINVGDTVRFINTQGTHNVHGGEDDFPDNPEFFSSGVPTPAPWEFEYVFNEPGEYGFHCTQGNHSSTQFGVITVVIPNSLNELPAVEVGLYPNPVVDRLAVESSEVIDRVELRDVHGRLVFSERFNGAMNKIYLSTFELSSGLYSVSVFTNEGVGVKQLFKD